MVTPVVRTTYVTRVTRSREYRHTQDRRKKTSTEIAQKFADRKKSALIAKNNSALATNRRAKTAESIEGPLVRPVQLARFAVKWVTKALRSALQQITLLID